MTAVLYVAATPAGVRYVGVTSQKPRRRWMYHMSDALTGRGRCKRLATAIRAGEITLESFSVLCDFPDLETAKLAEIAAVAVLKPELNMTPGGDCRGPHTPESKARIGAASRGNKHRLGKPHSAETRALMSIARAGKRFPNSKSKGPRDTSKAVAASAAMRRGKPNPAHAEKIRGRKHSAETREKMRNAQQARRAAEASCP